MTVTLKGNPNSGDTLYTAEGHKVSASAVSEVAIWCLAVTAATPALLLLCGLCCNRESIDHGVKEKVFHDDILGAD